MTSNEGMIELNEYLTESENTLKEIQKIFTQNQ